ncbi:hypothetical protein Tsubulata_018076 [Turnera subulata]|uniref:Uncharacterized protein n=1 Tax=Turnera subulata TaxID=218843 RepID=A0A9Q0J700_9ROSI|nr:hypothetical protein Tsubulata_018076 [Turnera subulata]
MRKFDPWPVFFRREWNRNWPFLVGFAITGTIITKFSLGLTEEDAKKSPFAQRHQKSIVFDIFASQLRPVFLVYLFPESLANITFLQALRLGNQRKIGAPSFLCIGKCLVPVP